MPRRTAPLPAALLAVVVAAAACHDRGAPQPGAGGDVRRYTVRGEVVQLPPSAGARTISLRHEAIDDLRDASGAVVGMGAMVMPFELGPAVPAGDLRAGDKVEVEVAVGWSPPLLRIEAVRKLPAGTVLEFRAARPPSPPDAPRR